MLAVPTPLVASLVPVTRATVEVESTVWVSKSLVLEHIDSVAVPDFNECTTVGKLVGECWKCVPHYRRL